MDDLWFPCRQLLPSNEQTAWLCQLPSPASMYVLVPPRCPVRPDSLLQEASGRRPLHIASLHPPLRRASVQPGHLAIMPTLGLACRAPRHPWLASAPCGSATLPSGATGCFLAIMESELVIDIATPCPHRVTVILCWMVHMSPRRVCWNPSRGQRFR
jgi:hypothetical protein